MVKYKRLTTKKEISEGCTLLDKYLGENFHPVKFYYDQPEITMYGALDGDTIIGVGTAMLLDTNLEDYDSYFLQTIGPDCGFLESAAIDENYRGRGIGKMLAITRMDILVHMGCDEVVALCWQSNQERTSLPLLKKLGFKEVEHFIQPWDGENCTVCGPKNCTCDAVLVHRSFK